MGHTLKYQGEPGNDEYKVDDWYDALMVRPDNYRRVLCVMETKGHSYHYFIGFYDREKSAWYIDRNIPIYITTVILWCELPPLPMEGLKHYGQ